MSRVSGYDERNVEFICWMSRDAMLFFGGLGLMSVAVFGARSVGFPFDKFLEGV